jgi:hypothetical protein
VTDDRDGVTLELRDCPDVRDFPVKDEIMSGAGIRLDDPIDDFTGSPLKKFVVLPGGSGT